MAAATCNLHPADDTSGAACRARPAPRPTERPSRHAVLVACSLAALAPEALADPTQPTSADLALDLRGGTRLTSDARREVYALVALTVPLERWVAPRGAPVLGFEDDDALPARSLSTSDDVVVREASGATSVKPTKAARRHARAEGGGASSNADGAARNDGATSESHGAGSAGTKRDAGELLRGDERRASDGANAAPAGDGAGDATAEDGAAAGAAAEAASAGEEVSAADEVLARVAAISPRFALEAVDAALRNAGWGSAATELDGMQHRARLSAVLPELRLRALRSTDQSLRYAPTVLEPDRFTQADGADLLFEARVTWRLSRLVFADEELGIERLRNEGRRQREQLAKRVVELLADWQKAQFVIGDPDALPEDLAEAWIATLQTELYLFVMTGGWSEGKLERLRRQARTER